MRVGASDAALKDASPANPSEWPAAASVDVFFANAPAAVCSGTLVSPDRVLTAAHCTACAVAAEVRLLGHWPVSPPIAVAQISTSPDAFPTPIPTSVCEAATKGEITEGLISRIRFAHDVAVLRLAEPVAIPPMKVLLEPPYGFSPVQDLYGQAATLPCVHYLAPGAYGYKPVAVPPEVFVEAATGESPGPLFP